VQQIFDNIPVNDKKQVLTRFLIFKFDRSS